MKNSLLSKVIPVLVIFGLLLTMVGAAGVSAVNAENIGLTREERKESSEDQNLNQSGSSQPLPEVKFQGYIYDKGIDGTMFHGFPLYASIHITQKNGSDFTIYSDPVTGDYSVFLLQGYVYTFEIRAMQPGYQPYIEEITAPHQLYYGRDFALNADNVLCSAPGYEPTYSVLYTFEDSDEGFTSGGTTSFAWGEFTSGPNEGHSGMKGIATNPAGNYNPNENGYMLSPEIDLSHIGTSAIVQWWEWRKTEEKNIWDNVSLEVTKDGGATWQKVW
jgi:hypothetical protein